MNGGCLNRMGVLSNRIRNELSRRQSAFPSRLVALAYAGLAVTTRDLTVHGDANQPGITPTPLRSRSGRNMTESDYDDQG